MCAAPRAAAAPASSSQAGGTQLDSGVSTGFWPYEVCMYVYGKS
jgi:hypothetical protein